MTAPELVWILLLVLAYACFQLCRPYLPRLIRNARRLAQKVPWPRTDAVAYTQYQACVSRIQQLWLLVIKMLGANSFLQKMTKHPAGSKHQKQLGHPASRMPKRRLNNPVWA